jgi:hypothetical protein
MIGRRIGNVRNVGMALIKRGERGAALRTAGLPGLRDTLVRRAVHQLAEA